jgi:hypothetical protein
LYWFPNCDVEIRGKRPTHCTPYRDLTKSSDDDAINKTLRNIVSEFKQDKLSLAMVYYENVDAVGHKYGPDDRKTKKAMRRVDALLGSLLNEIKDKNMEGEINVMLVSDHGMTTAQNVIQLERYMDFNDIEKAMGDGAMVMLQPEATKRDHVYEELRQANVRGLNVYKKNNIPSRLRLRKSRMTLPIVVTADKGYVIELPDINGKVYPEEDDDNNIQQGHHGYDPAHVEDMRGILYMWGPDVKANGKEPQSHIKQVDNYNIMAQLLGFEGKRNDGSRARIADLLKTGSDESTDSHSDESGSDSKEDGADDDKGGKGGATALVVSGLSLATSLSFILLSLILG